MILSSVRPGGRALRPGQLKIVQDYDQDGLSTLEIELSRDPSTDAAQHDRLDVGGTARIDGRLSVRLRHGFVPWRDDVFTIITAETRSPAYARSTADQSSTRSPSILPKCRALQVATPKPWARAMAATAMSMSSMRTPRLCSRAFCSPKISLAASVQGSHSARALQRRY
jgi:hypothetical protein